MEKTENKGLLSTNSFLPHSAYIWQATGFCSQRCEFYPRILLAEAVCFYHNGPRTAIQGGFRPDSEHFDSLALASRNCS
jgi:hypothetical protein